METKISTRHRKQEEMFSLITAWKNSGISQRDFCQEHQIPYSVFQYWLKKVKKQDTDQAPGFIEMKISPPATFATELEIIFPSGVKVVFKNHPDPSFIRSLAF